MYWCMLRSLLVSHPGARFLLYIDAMTVPNEPLYTYMCKHALDRFGVQLPRGDYHLDVVPLNDCHLLNGDQYVACYGTLNCGRHQRCTLIKQGLAAIPVFLSGVRGVDEVPDLFIGMVYHVSS